MRVRWVLFCLEASFPVAQEKFKTLIMKENPSAVEQIHVQRKYWRDPVRYWMGCEYAADQMPEDMKAKVAWLGGCDAVSVLELDNRVEMLCSSTVEEMSSDPNRMSAVGCVYKDL